MSIDRETVAGSQTQSRKLDAKSRISRVVEAWFLTEPMLFAAWTTHDVVSEPRVTTIRVGRGKVEYNSAFVEGLKPDELKQVLAFEAMRILLGHPYSRRQPNGELSYMASNLTVQEYLRCKLPVPRARELFDDEAFDDQYFEFYYRELAERSRNEDPPEDDAPKDDAPEDDDGATDESGEDKPDEDSPGEDESSDDESGDEESGDDGSGDSDLDSYVDPQAVGTQNTAQWDEDDLFKDEIHGLIQEAAENDGWGTLSAQAKERLLATLNPVLDYRAVLRSFRQSVLSVRRRLTRMKPSRRYGFDQMGSRYDFTTKLLFAVDVSGSITREDLTLGFSVVSRFFRYGVESVDVIWFDTEIRGEPLTLRRARHAFDVTGRGGTDFKPVMAYLNEHRQYDGLIVFTDGQAPVPPRPNNTRTRVMWLFRDQKTHDAMAKSLAPIGKSAFLK